MDVESLHTKEAGRGGRGAGWQVRTPGGEGARDGAGEPEIPRQERRPVDSARERQGAPAPGPRVTREGPGLVLHRKEGTGPWQAAR